jgi:hypothetical protein
MTEAVKNPNALVVTSQDQMLETLQFSEVKKDLILIFFCHI